MSRVLTSLVSVWVLAALAVPAAADAPIAITSSGFTNNFRRNLVFQVQAQDRVAQITRVELLVQLEGSPAIDRLAADFEPGAAVQATYEWNLARGYLPPGASGQSWWEIGDSAGNQLQSPPRPFRVEDQTHSWKQVANPKLALNWYAGSDNIVERSDGDTVNFLGLVFAAVCVCITLGAVLLAFIFRHRRGVFVAFILVALCACAAPPLVFHAVGDARTRGDAPPMSFGQALFNHGIRSLEYLERDTGVVLERRIQVYIYADRDDFFDAIEPGAKEWTGGRAYPQFGVVMIDIHPADWEWGKRALAHEITHQVIHQKIRSPLGGLSLPPLIDEGLAVYYESPGSPGVQFVTPLRRAIKNDTLIPLRALTKAFAAEPDAATLSYAESYSVVDFIFRRYGRDRMAQLLQAFKQGGFYDDIFARVFGMNLDGLEEEWRKDIGAKPRVVPTRAVATPFPTFSLSTEATPTPAR